MKERWGLSEQEIEDRWQSALRDPNVPKGVDEEGWQTVAKYADQSVGSKRQLEHHRSVQKQDAIEADDQQLRSVMNSSSDTESTNQTLNSTTFSNLGSLSLTYEMKLLLSYGLGIVLRTCACCCCFVLKPCEYC